jgi:hypothetical protein
MTLEILILGVFCLSHLKSPFWRVWRTILLHQLREGLYQWFGRLMRLMSSWWNNFVVWGSHFIRVPRFTMLVCLMVSLKLWALGPLVWIQKVFELLCWGIGRLHKDLLLVVLIQAFKDCAGLLGGVRVLHHQWKVLVLLILGAKIWAERVLSIIHL